MANLALYKPVTVSNFVAPFSGDRAVNGSSTAASRWVGEIGYTNPITPASLTVDLQGYFFVNRWVIKHMSGVAGWTPPQYSMSDFALQSSMDGKVWCNIDSVTGNTVNLTDRTFNTAYSRFFRVNVTKGLNCNNKIASILDFELYDAPPTSPYLSNLTIDQGTLAPVFSKNTYNYTATVGFGVTTINVTPTAETPSVAGQNATILVNGVLVQSGKSTPVNLNVGSNKITINVTSVIGGLQQQYVIDVTRSDSNLLTSLSLANGTAPITISPNFDKMVNQYTASIGGDVAGVMVTAVKEGSTAILSINGNPATSGTPYGPITMNPGPNTITVADVVGTTTNTYNIVVTKPSGSSQLNQISVSYPKSGGTTTLNIPVVSGTTVYSADLPGNVKSISITPVADDPGARITIGSTTVSSGQTISNVAIQPPYKLTITVVASDNSSTTSYTLNIV